MTQAWNEDNTLKENNLIIGTPIKTIEAVLLSGQNCTRGTLLGKITKSTPTTGTAKVGNTGNGICGSVSAGSATKLGIYTIRCEDATTEGSEQWGVYTPDGIKLFTAVTDVAYSTTHINFIITAGGTGFAVGDEFTITVTAGSGKYKKALLAANDGSQETDTMAILAEDADATSADVNTIAYIVGDFNETRMTFGTGFTAANVKDALATRGIILRDVIQAVVS